MEHFYADQPELSLRFYRRLLQMGVHNAELYNNLGLSCFYAQQYDMTLTCMERALSLAEEPEVIADVWYNLGHIGKKNASSFREIKIQIQLVLDLVLEPNFLTFFTFPLL